MSFIPFISMLILKVLSLKEKLYMHHNIIVVMALERVYKLTFADDELNSNRLRLMEYNSSFVNVTLYTYLWFDPDEDPLRRL